MKRNYKYWAQRKNNYKKNMKNNNKNYIKFIKKKFKIKIINKKQK